MTSSSFNEITNTRMKHLKLTPAQKELLELLEHKEAEDYFESLKTVHYLATYCVGNEMVELSASRDVHDLLDVIQKISIENNKN
jgi:hypothetical protein